MSIRPDDSEVQKLLAGVLYQQNNETLLDLVRGRKSEIATLDLHISAEDEVSTFNSGFLAAREPWRAAMISTCEGDDWGPEVVCWVDELWASLEGIPARPRVATIEANDYETHGDLCLRAMLTPRWLGNLDLIEQVDAQSFLVGGPNVQRTMAEAAPCLVRSGCDSYEISYNRSLDAVQRVVALAQGLAVSRTELIGLVGIG